MFVALSGSHGFVGSACKRALLREGIHVRGIAVPRLSTRARTQAQLVVQHDVVAIEALARQIAGCEVVVNAAGIAQASSPDQDKLFGANGLLPLWLARAAETSGAARFVHISSAAVQGGSAVLDESPRLEPTTPYAASKAVGEQVVDAFPGIPTVIFRPTSVHGSGRHVTSTVARLARSRWSAVSGDGSSPTPQVHIDNVAAAVGTLVQSLDTPPPRVLQPSEGFTVATFLRTMGLGREPKHVPRLLLHAAVATGHAAFRDRALDAHVRRLEMLTLGQMQADGWLAGVGFSPPAGCDEWQRLAHACATEGP